MSKLSQVYDTIIMHLSFDAKHVKASKEKKIYNSLSSFSLAATWCQGPQEVCYAHRNTWAAVGARCDSNPVRVKQHFSISPLTLKHSNSAVSPGTSWAQRTWPQSLSMSLTGILLLWKRGPQHQTPHPSFSVLENHLHWAWFCISQGKLKSTIKINVHADQVASDQQQQSMNSFPSSPCPASPLPQHRPHKILTEFKQQDMPLSNSNI